MSNRLFNCSMWNERNAMLTNKERAELKLAETARITEELAVDCCIVKSIFMNPSNESLSSDDRLRLQQLSRDNVAVVALVAELGRRRDAKLSSQVQVMSHLRADKGSIDPNPIY